jgi:hypothetical protein
LSTSPTKNQKLKRSRLYFWDVDEIGEYHLRTEFHPLAIYMRFLMRLQRQNLVNFELGMSVGDGEDLR